MSLGKAQQDLSGFVDERCKECKKGFMLKVGEYSKIINANVIMCKIFVCNKCGFKDKRCS
ncbi:hypothetical protein LCGC14_2826100 [marine sediment metagenome]|uniref:Uncharacterized protein n=1 Tax=marine sediment metagenome TaxID=412755 RepID=A0A0F8Z279_9ZZZZ